MELKPCPFCGGHAIFETYGEPDTAGNFGITAICLNISGCGCRLEYRDTKEEVIEAWNRRAGNA